jgi:hypothetical protein
MSDVNALVRETHDLASALNFLAEVLETVDAELASAHGLGVVLNILAEHADKIYGDVLRASETADQTPAPTDDGEPTRALRSVKTGGVQ